MSAQANTPPIFYPAITHATDERLVSGGGSQVNNGPASRRSTPMARTPAAARRVAVVFLMPDSEEDCM
jgi:hypothetical protein